MRHRFSFWLRQRLAQLPLQLSVFNWPPLLSHALAFIVGTLVLQKGEAVLRLPAGKILVPVDKLGRLETDGKAWKEPQRLTLLAKKDDVFCRISDEDLLLWKAPGRSGSLYVQWPPAREGAIRLQQALQKKAVLSAEGSRFAFCGSDAKAGESKVGAVVYD